MSQLELKIEGEPVDFEGKLRNILLDKHPISPSLLEDVDREILLNNILNKYKESKSFNSTKKEEVLKEIQGKTFEEIKELYWDQDSDQSNQSDHQIAA